MNKEITIKYNQNKTATMPKNTRIIDFVKTLPENIQNRIIGAKIDNVIVELNTILKRDTTIDFFDVNDLAGYKMYQAGLKFVLECALKDTYGENMEVVYNHSIARGIHATIEGPITFTKDMTSKLKNKMATIIQNDLPIKKLNITSKEAYHYYISTNNLEKAHNIHNISNSLVLLYQLENHINYFYVEMPYSTRCLNLFDLTFLNENELVLLFPTPRSKNAIPEYIHYEKVIACFKEEKDWLRKKNIPYVADINSLISQSRGKDLVRLCETNYDNHINDLAKKALSSGAKYIMVSGPSSSGKTTTTKKLAMNLEAQGYSTLLISTDDYFHNREDSPKNPDGSYNFECLETIDLKKLNEDLLALIKGEEIKRPTFNFISGKREYSGEKMQLKENGIILIEGLHCLNDDLTYAIDPKLKYKIYLSPFIPLNIDRHNYISTVDLRLIRRIIRDNRSRGNDVSKTIESWQSVRAGEEKYIFPYIHQADAILNTALAYEPGALKVYAEPLLYSVTNDSKYYEEARRLISFLKSFFPISSEYITKESVLREFIGSGNFEK